MKFATYRNGHRDGQLMLVSRDLKCAISIPQVASTLQALIDDWSTLSPTLETLYDSLNESTLSDIVHFDESQCLSPLPRAYQWADASAYVNHVELVRKARGAEMPASFWKEPLVYQGGADSFLAPKQNIELESEEWGIDFESEIAVITDDVIMGCTNKQAEKHIKLLMLVNDVSLRNLIPSELAKGFGFFQSKPSSSFSPVAVTPDELTPHWQNNKLHLPLMTHFNGKLFGQPNAGVDMTFDFSQLIAHITKTRPIAAGTIIGSGTVSNYDRSKGSSCLAEKRMLEIIEQGEAQTQFMQFGDSVCIEMLDENGNSIFGAIDQKVVKYTQ